MMEEKKPAKIESNELAESRLNSTSKGTRTEGPDVGFAWIVALAACTINFIMAGLGRMSGILFVAFIEIFHVDRKSASMPFSIKSSARNLFGPVVGILGQKYGARKVIVSGSIVCVISAAACFFAPDIVWITVLWGGVCGLGSALIVTLPQVVIGQYFEEYRTTASGMAFSGGCVGSFVFPVLLEYLLHNYGIEGTFLIIAGVIMHTIPAALILRKPRWLKGDSVQQKETDLKPLSTPSVDNLANVVGRTRIHSVNECTPKRFTPKTSRRESSVTGINNLAEVRGICLKDGTPKKNTSKISKLVFGEHPDVKFMRDNSELLVKILTLRTSEHGSEVNPPEECSVLNEIEVLFNSLMSSPEKSQFQRNLRQVKSDFIYNEVRPTFDPKYRSLNVSRKLFESEANLVPKASIESNTFVLSRLSEINGADEQQIVAHFQEEKSKVSIILSKLRKLSKLSPRVVSKNAVDIQSKEIASKDCSPVDKALHSNSFLDLIKTAFKLYANPLFLMVCFCRAVHFIAFIPAMTTVVDFSMDKGLHEDDGKFAIAAISLGDLMGRLCFGWVTDRGFMTLPKYMMVVMIIQGISTASLPMMHTKATIFACLAVFGMLQGSLFVRHPVLITKYMKNDEQSIAMGCVNFFSGILGFGIPIYIGYFRDTMGSYDSIFYLNGMLGACVGLLWVFEPFFVSCVNAKRKTQKIIV